MHDGGRVDWKQKEVPFPENPDGEQQKGSKDHFSDPHTAALLHGDGLVKSGLSILVLN